MKSIVISGPPAIGKTTVAKGIAKEFGLKYLSGGDVLKELANESGINTGGEDWWDTEGGMNFLNQRKKNFEFDKKVDKRLAELFEKGDVVITSYTLPWISKGGIKIWLNGSLHESAQRMTKRDSLTLEQASSIVKTRFEENKKIYKKLYGFDFGDDLSVFHCILETDNQSAQEVISQAIEKIKLLI